MASLLVALAVMSILMSAALPAWRHQARREKEAELVFRGEQYVRAIRLYAARNANTFPPSFDVLVQQKYLRKKYKDPMSPDGEFLPRYAGLNQTPGDGGRGRAGGPSQGRGSTPTSPTPTPTGVGSGLGGGAGQPGGIIGVISKSKDSSIMVYRGMTHYNEWPFIYANLGNRPGGGAGPGAPPGGRGRGGLPAPGMPGGPSGGRGRSGPGRGVFPGGTPMPGIRGGGPGQGF
jgi:type II secretory pathway pseudopilin PulG